MEQNQMELVNMLTELVEQEPAYVIGQRMINQLSQQTGMDPGAAAEALLYAAPTGTQALCTAAAQGLMRLQEGGQDVEAYLADPAFVSLLRDMPPAAALRLYDAERAAQAAADQAREQGARDMLEKIMARRNLPAPIRGNIPADGQPDYANMSSAAFAQVKKRLAQAASQGLHPSL